MSINKKTRIRMVKLAGCLCLLSFIVSSVACKDKVAIYPNHYDTSVGTILDSLPTTFVHPGILHTAERIATLKQIVQKADPASVAYMDFQLLSNDSKSKSDYAMKGPFDIISRDGVYKSTKGAFESDFSAAYLNALIWAVTGNKEHAEEARKILLAYADKLKEIEVSNDAPLLAGLQGFQVMYAAEILGYTYPDMSSSDFDKIKTMVKNVFLPVLDKFYATPPYTNGNWGIIVTKAYMAAGILLDDHEMYKRAVDFYLNGNDNGTLPNYVDGETGQCQESGRDQGHAQLGIGGLGELCEVAFQQGTDLYSQLDNRLLLGYEYVAKYNLGNDVPFKTWKDVTGKYSSWTVVSPDSRGAFRTIYAVAYNHYAGLEGLSMPSVEEVVNNKLKLEGYDADNIGYGTFQFALH